MTKYISTSALVLFLCGSAGAQNYNTGPLHVAGTVYDASASGGSLLAATGNLTVSNGGTWLLNNALLTTPRTGSSQAELVRFNGGSYSRTTGYVNGYAAADSQAPGFVMPVGQGTYMPLTVTTALASGSPLVAAWYDDQPLVTTTITDPGSGTSMPYYFLPGYYDLRTAAAGSVVIPTVPAGAFSGTHVIGTTDGINFTDLGPAAGPVALPAGVYQLRFANSSFVLPLTLTAFTAAREGSAAFLSWKLSSEQGVRSYTVERSADGHRFTAIGSLPSLGNTSQERTYTLHDAAPLKGANYYRLQIAEAGGKVSYSSVRLLSFDAVLRISLFPNPVAGKATITGLEAGMQVTLINLQGQRLLSRKATQNTLELSLEHLPAAVYEVQVQDAAGKPAGSYRIIKE